MSSSETLVFPVALNLRDRAVLVIGGGEEAAQKVPKLLDAGARVTLVAAEVDERLAAQARAGRLCWFARHFTPHDVRGAHVVMLTEIDRTLARELRALASCAHFWLCAIDQPEFSDFYLVSTVTRGPVQIGISTGGSAPLLARRLRQALDSGLDGRFSEFARSFAGLRARVRALPKAERSQLLTRALEGFAMEVRLRYPEPCGHEASSPDQARGS